jgi:hypothetical protein
LPERKKHHRKVRVIMKNYDIVGGAKVVVRNQKQLHDLQTQEAVFDFKVQVQTDAVAMPVEDVSVEWDENVSKPVTVATLRIAPQSVDGSGDLAKRCESMSFNPWHALAEHRPMGGINRLRQAVYPAS